MAYAHAGYYGADSLTTLTGVPHPPGTVVSVFLPGTSTPATLYSDRDRTPLVGAAVVAADGNFGFHAEPGEYDISVAPGEGVRVVALPDPRDGVQWADLGNAAERDVQTVLTLQPWASDPFSPGSGNLDGRVFPTGPAVWEAAVGLAGGSGGWRIVASQAGRATGASGAAVQPVDTGELDHRITAVYAATPGAGAWWLVARYDPATDTGYAAQISGSTNRLRLVRIAAGVVSDLTGPFTPALGDTVGIDVHGDQVTLLHAGTPVAVITDDTITTGTRVGLRTTSTNTTFRFDNVDISTWQDTPSTGEVVTEEILDDLRAAIAATYVAHDGSLDVGDMLVVASVNPLVVRAADITMDDLTARLDDLSARVTAIEGEVVEPPPDVITSDSFDRANGALGVTDGALGGASGVVWSTDGSAFTDRMQISGSQVFRTGGGGRHYATVDAGSADVFASAKVAALGAANSMSIVARATMAGSAGTYHSLRVSAAGDVGLTKRVSGSPTSLTATLATVVVGDRVGLLVSGTTIAAYVEVAGEWVQVGSTSDSSITVGSRAGLVIDNDSSCRWDDFRLDTALPVEPPTPEDTMLLTGQSLAIGVGPRLSTQLVDLDLDLIVGAERGQAYNAIRKGGSTGCYERILSAVGALPDGVAVPGVVVVHGTRDMEIGTTREQYAGFLADWLADFTADVTAATGQSDDLVMVVSQPSSWETQGLPGATVGLGVLDADDADPLMACCGPEYPYGYKAPGDVHLSAAGYQRLAERIRATLALVLAGTWGGPLRPATAVRAGTVITVEFTGLEGALVLDTTSLPAQPDFGLSFHDDTSSAAIASVAVVGDTLEVTLDGTPTGGNPRLGFGTSAAQVINLRGTSTDLYSDLTPMHPWCVHAEVEVTT